MDQNEASLPAPAAAQWRVFLRAMAEEIDSLAGPDERDDMLRGVGRRMAGMLRLPSVQTLDALEIEMNDALGSIGWGQVRLELREAEPALRIIHVGIPRIGSLGSPPGQWLAALLEGLYDGWLEQQPGSKPSLSSQRAQNESGPTICLRYARR